MDAISYNPFAEDFYADLEKKRALYRCLRNEAPAHWDAQANMWVLSRYEDVRSALQNWKMFSSEAGGGSFGEAGEWYKEYPNLLMFDPPRHTRMRRILAGLITPDRMNGLAGQIREIVTDLLDSLDAHAGFDLTQDFATKVPSLVIADLLGIPREDAPILMAAVNKLADYHQADPETATREALSSMADYYTDFMNRRAKGEPGDDIIWHLLEGMRNGILERNEAIGYAILTTIAGGETTTHMIGHVAHLLYIHPDQRELLLESPELMRNAIEEALRFNSSTQMLTRTLTEDFTIHGQTMPAGDTVALIFNSANNDDRKYSDPDRFDIQREHKRDHLAFGGGVHACIGAPLARLELVIVLEELLKRWPRYELDLDKAVQHRNPFVTGWHSLPLRAD